ncbi:MAG: GNAT family N-acetyltransferase [Cyanobacteria bacterium HKST-UBA02]|nr:GNAT family N-acetyltransferase [Cyanobacteria bacterium HKST-UBA02]
MNRKPFLLGQNIYLKALTVDEITDSYLSWLNDENVCRFNSHHVFPYTRAGAEAYVSGLENSRDSLVLAVYVRDKDIHIGNISLGSIDFLHRNAEFAILMGEQDYWGRGLAKEAALLIVRHGFETLNLHRVYCGTSAENVAMQKLAAYMGMLEEGRRRQAMFKCGRYVDVIEYGVLREEFLKCHPAK